MLQPETTGIEYLTALIQAQFDPDAADPIPPELPGSRKNGTSKTIEHLRRQMAQRLAEKVRQEFRPGVAGLFVLTARQDRTLRTLDLYQETVEQVLSLNWLRQAPDNFAVNSRLETIAAMPSTKGDEAPSWKRWWLDHSNSRIGIARPQDHDPLKDPVSEMLNQVIRAMAEAARPEIPNHVEMARYMLENGVPDGFNNKLVQPVKGKLDLTQVWVMGVRIRELAWRMGITMQEHQARRPESPEALAAELKDQGITARQDMGTINGLEQLRKALREAEVAEIYANARSGLWHDRRANDSYMLDHRGYANNWTNQLWIGEKDDPAILRTKAEWELMTLTVPEHPGLEYEPIRSPDQAAASVGFLNRVSPKAAREYLDGRSEEPNPPQPARCPRAAGCPSWCGRMQETGEFPFPLTHDGRYESCRYWQFLERYGTIEPRFRESFAQAAVDAELGESKRRQREKIQERGQPEIEAAREDTEPETGPSDGKAQEKQPENRQAALF